MKHRDKEMLYFWIQDDCVKSSVLCGYVPENLIWWTRVSSCVYLGKYSTHMDLLAHTLCVCVCVYICIYIYIYIYIHNWRHMLRKYKCLGLAIIQHKTPNFGKYLCILYSDMLITDWRLSTHNCIIACILSLHHHFLHSTGVVQYKTTKSSKFC